MKEKNLKNECGISLVALLVTVVVLLILAGIGVEIANNIILDKAISVSNITNEKTMEDKIKLAFHACEIAYYNDKNNNPNIDKDEYYIQNLPIYLNSIDGIYSIALDTDYYGNLKISYSYEGKKYIFSENDGIINLTSLIQKSVKVGDYFAYPVEYDDVYLEDMHYTSKNGWIVIDDGVMNGTSGKIKIISSGIPAKAWCDPDNVDGIIDELTNNFEDTYFANIKGKYTIKGSDFKIDSIASNISSVTLAELNYAHNAIYKNEPPRNADSIVSFNINNSIFNIHNMYKYGYYWLNTKNGNQVYYTKNSEIKLESNKRYGIRPVVTLNID